MTLAHLCCHSVVLYANLRYHHTEELGKKLENSKWIICRSGAKTPEIGRRKSAAVDNQHGQS